MASPFDSKGDIPDAEMAAIDDELLVAMIEGDGDPSVTHPDKTKKMLEGVRKGSAFSASSYIGGPIYWAYRRCYLAAVVCLAAYALIINIVLYSGNKMIELVPPFVTGALFYWMYGQHAATLVGKMRKLGLSGEPALDFLRQRGGVDLKAAIGAGVGFLALAAASVAVYFVLSQG